MSRKKNAQRHSTGKKAKSKDSSKQSRKGTKGRSSDSSKSKATEHSKAKRGTFKKSRGPEIEDELCKMGLRAKYMPADGNCFFRSLGDQLHGHDRNHFVIRQQVMTFMEEHRALFELFVEPCLEENEDFDSYISDMREAGNWAGDFEVHAASLCFEVDICIYQIDNDKLQCLCNKNPESRKLIHISYHGGEHYNSVRRWNDYSDDPPLPIELNGTSANAAPNTQNWSWKDEKRIMEDTGCHNDGLIHTYLAECNGNVNEVIECVIEWMNENNCITEKAAFLQEDENNPLNVDCSASEDEVASETSTPPASNEETYQSGNKVLREDHVMIEKRKPANNKPCPCGSRKPYKKCCKILEAKRQREMKQRDEMRHTSTDRSEEVSAQQELALLYI